MSGELRFLEEQYAAFAEAIRATSVVAPIFSARWPCSSVNDDGCDGRDVARWQAEPPEHLHSWERLSRDRVRTVWQGPQVVDEAGGPVHQLSIYYKWWKDYDPFAVPAKDLALPSG